MPQEDVAFLIKIIHDRIGKIANQSFNSLGIRLSQARFLEYLHKRKKLKISQKKLEDIFKISHPTTVGILKRLERKGLIRTQFDDDDKRIKIVYPTSKVSLIYDKIKENKKKMEQDLVRGITDKQKEELVTLLKILYNNIPE